MAVAATCVAVSSAGVLVSRTIYGGRRHCGDAAAQGVQGFVRYGATDLAPIGVEADVLAGIAGWSEHRGYG